MRGAANLDKEKPEILTQFVSKPHTANRVAIRKTRRTASIASLFGGEPTDRGGVTIYRPSLAQRFISSMLRSSSLEPLRFGRRPR